MEILGYVLAAVVGLTLGLIGSGGSILTVPILVYIMGVDPVLATAYSLFIVGATSLVGGMQRARQKKVDFKTVLIFGIPSIASVYATRKWIVPVIPDEIFSIQSFTLTKGVALLLLFAVVMIIAALSMIKTPKYSGDAVIQPIIYNYPAILIQGILIGLLAGMVGAGGGFLIIPALVLLAKMPMKLAVGTSLFIIAAQSLIGFTGDMQGDYIIDWKLLSIFTAISVAGIFAGIRLGRKIPSMRLKKAFGWFVLVMGIYIIIREVFLS